MPDREKIIAELSERANGAGVDAWMTLKCSTAREIIALLREQRWIPVTERLPEETGRMNGYLVAIGAWVGIMPFYNGQFPRADGEPITHWMPLPEPPKGEDDEN